MTVVGRGGVVLEDRELVVAGPDARRLDPEAEMVLVAALGDGHAPAATGWQDGTMLIATGPGALIGPGSAVALGTPGGFGADPPAAVRASAALRGQRSVETVLGAGARTVLVVVEAEEPGAEPTTPEVSLAAAGTPIAVAGGGRTVLVVPLDELATERFSVAVGVAESSRLAGVLGVPGPAGEWAERLADGAAPRIAGGWLAGAGGAVQGPARRRDARRAGPVTGDPPPIGALHLFDRVDPALPAGEYTLGAGQVGTALRGTLPGQATVVGDAALAMPKLVVDAPRLILEPREVAGMHPPPGADGAFTQTLPHVVLSRRTLPWERRAGTDAATARPWLALLVTGPGEAELATQQPLAPAVPAAVAAALGADAQTRCDLLRLSRALLQDVLPRPAELSLLAHARRVNLGQKALAGDDVNGWFAVVLANRLPEPGVLNRVSLVSLEARDDLGPAGSADVSLVTLATWTFTCSPAGGTFADLVQGLEAAPFGDASSDPPGGRAVELAARSRAGVNGTTTYRGPLLPAPAAPAPLTLSASADALRPAGDGADISDAAAFELGRLLALSDAALCQALLSGRARGGWRFELVSPHLSREDLERLRQEILDRELMLDLAGDLLGTAIESVLTHLPTPSDPRNPPVTPGGGFADPVRDLGRFGELMGIDVNDIVREIGQEILTQPGSVTIERWAQPEKPADGPVLEVNLDRGLDRERGREGGMPPPGYPGHFP